MYFLDTILWEIFFFLKLEVKWKELFFWLLFLSIFFLYFSVHSSNWVILSVFLTLFTKAVKRCNKGEHRLQENRIKTFQLRIFSCHFIIISPIHRRKLLLNLLSLKVSLLITGALFIEYFNLAEHHSTPVLDCQTQNPFSSNY